jgi:prepilin peptidase CpaA
MEKFITAVPIDVFLIILLSVVLIIAAIIDMRTYRIPNLLTYPTMLLALIYHTATNGVNGLIFSSLGLLVGIGLFSIPFFMGVMGAGDAKLMGAVGAVIGSRGVLNASLFTAVAGGVFALILLLSHYRDFRFFTRTVESIQASLATKCFIRIPVAENKEKPRLYYGIAIASGTLYTMWWKVSHTGFPL